MDDMINSAKILKLCNDIEDIVTDMDVHLRVLQTMTRPTGWAECMEIISKIKQIGEELKETQERQPKTNGDYIRLMTDDKLADVLEWQCACCVYRPVDCKSECHEGHLKWLQKDVSANDER